MDFAPENLESISQKLQLFIHTLTSKHQTCVYLFSMFLDSKPRSTAKSAGGYCNTYFDYYYLL